MSTKGDATKKQIREEAKKLFAKNGFTRVTMKDVCEAAGISRGGLYRHYESTAVIFEEIFEEMAKEAQDFMEVPDTENVSAEAILKNVLDRLKREVLDEENSLSLAVYEYSQNKERSLFVELNKRGRKRWIRLIEYGMKRGEFKKVEVNEVTDMILYSYQGLRLFSKVTPLTKQTVHNWVHFISTTLLV